MMNTILNNWSVMRGFRLAVGVIALGLSIDQKDITLGLLAGLLLLTEIANVGCCGSNGCAVDYKNTKKEKEVVYEKVDTIK